MENQLTALPFDIVTLIANHLMPYDVLALSTTCKLFRPLMFNKSVWLHITEQISRSRPLPFLPISTPRLPLNVLHQASLRAQRVAKKWTEDVVYPKPFLRRFSFPDRRIISYFAFLPGARHLLLFDVVGTISCWTCEGVLLDKWEAGVGSQLTRWKPSETNGVHEWMDSQAVEIMIDHPQDPEPSRSEIVWLTFSETRAHFSALKEFTVPAVYVPFSALTQDEIHGMLTIIPPENIGVYLVDTDTGKAICIDTGLRPAFGQEYSPQSLLSDHHMVLYWETARGAETHAYETPHLRELLQEMGVPQDDERLSTPIPVAPSSSGLIPFTSTATTQFKRWQSLIPSEPSRLASDTTTGEFNLSMNWDWNPIIIPKWPTLREDMTQHRVRSIMTLSKRFGTGAVVEDLIGVIMNEANGNGLPGAAPGALMPFALPPIPNPNVNQANPQPTQNDINNHVQMVIDALEAHEHGNGNDHIHIHINPVGNVPMVNGDGQEPPAPAPVVFHLPAPEMRTTITHHYFDFSSHPRELRRTILANVRLRSLSFPDDREIHVDESYAGSPVIGYGGRCALWIEEEDTAPTEPPEEMSGQDNDQDDVRPGTTKLSMKLVTFPSFEGDIEPGVEESKVITLVTPNEISLEEAFCLDLDDARGVVGIATGSGDLWLVDYS